MTGVQTCALPILTESVAGVPFIEFNFVRVLCINFDTTDYKNASHALEIFTNVYKDTDSQEKNETFVELITESIESIFKQAEAKIGKEPTTMNRIEKIKLVKELEKNGVFRIKGGVDHIALLMGISKYNLADTG